MLFRQHFNSLLLKSIKNSRQFHARPKKFFFFILKIKFKRIGNYLAVQWLGLSIFTDRAQFWSLVGELRFCKQHGIAKTTTNKQETQQIQDTDLRKFHTKNNLHTKSNLSTFSRAGFSDSLLSMKMFISMATLFFF